ncbi:MoaD/ThiS family protein [Allobranchiibius huperziae]|uniref:Molybdopterin converting factor small subunit n=1 Tax=Allobranchiibius huperziae TaxID=1874116 RepID=A0A853DIX8_9MICO|nr:MoaD/ThiS family protein [Allobranchiibius huperziae]NYJ75919.1 molybdopterin converting factor small subunit [Allobranchiibius huperziae]
MAQIVVRYWAGAQAAAGTPTEQLNGLTVGDVVAAATQQHPELRPVFALAALLMNGSRVDAEDPLVDGATLEVLPPFAGG